MASQVDADKSERKVWIVRVPPYVAKQWHKAIERSKEAPIDEKVDEEVLGRITIENGVATTLSVTDPTQRNAAQPGAAESARQTLFMNPNRDTVDTSIISYEPGPPQPKKKAAGTPAVPPILNAKVDGVVHKRYDAAPVRITDVPQSELGVPGAAGLNPEQAKREAEQRQQAAMQGQADAAYLQNSRKRLAAAAAQPKTQRKLQVLTDMKEMRELAANMGGGDLGKVQQQTSKFDEQRTAKAASLAKGKRVRMERDELEQELFKKFGDQPLWHFTQLQKELDQPIAYLKEVLNEMATQIKRGPNKDLWELKKHLVTGEEKS